MYMPTTSTGPPKIFTPAASATTVSTVPVTAQRASAAERVAEHDPRPVRGREQQPAGEAGLEVAGDSEAREDTDERGRLDQDEAELERRVAGLEVEARQVPDLRATREGGEEEEREDQRGEEERRVREDVLQRPPGHPEATGRILHVRAASP